MNQSNRYLKKICLLFLVLSVALGCGTARVPQSTGNQDDTIKDDTSSTIIDVPIYVDDLVNNTKKYQNQLVTIRGTFMGWKGSCKVTPPETRSDWMIEYDGACIYVSGPPPSGIDITPTSKDIGKEIEIYGRAILDKSGALYIKVINQ